MRLAHRKLACIALTTIALALASTSCEAGDASGPASGADLPFALETGWLMRVPKERIVAYRGDASFDKAGRQGGQILYMAPNALGAAVEMVTHGVLVAAGKSREKSKLQEEADKVLEPYQPVLNDFEEPGLMQRALDLTGSRGRKALLLTSDRPVDAWIVDSDPVFSMTQDQTAIVLDNSVSIYRPGPPAKAAYHYTVRVVSATHDESDPVAFWTGDAGARLKEESAALLALSLDIALGQAAGASPRDGAVDKTIHYVYGKSERVERGRLVDARCDRVLIRTLRGWLMSVPVAQTESDAGADLACAGAPTGSESGQGS